MARERCEWVGLPEPVAPRWPGPRGPRVGPAAVATPSPCCSLRCGSSCWATLPGSGYLVTVDKRCNPSQSKEKIH